MQTLQIDSPEAVVSDHRGYSKGKVVPLSTNQCSTARSAQPFEAGNRTTKWAWSQPVSPKLKLLLLAFSEDVAVLGTRTRLDNKQVGHILQKTGYEWSQISALFAELTRIEVAEIEVIKTSGRPGKWELLVTLLASSVPYAEYAPMIADRPGWVYLMQSGSWYKIGRSLDPVQRANMLEKSTAERVRILSQRKVADAVAYEQYLHQRYARWRGHGEWFGLKLPHVHNLRKALRGRFVDRQGAFARNSGDGVIEDLGGANS